MVFRSYVVIEIWNLNVIHVLLIPPWTTTFFSTFLTLHKSYSIDINEFDVIFFFSSRNSKTSKWATHFLLLDSTKSTLSLLGPTFSMQYSIENVIISYNTESLYRWKFSICYISIFIFKNILSCEPALLHLQIIFNAKTLISLSAFRVDVFELTDFHKLFISCISRYEKYLLHLFT